MITFKAAENVREAARELPLEAMLVGAERLFEETFGLYVQVMRKSGDTWLVTSVTDSLTLEQQNAKGRAGENVNFLPEDEYDYREQE